MNRPDPIRVLVIGDPYMPASAYAQFLAGLGDKVAVTSMQIADIASVPPRPGCGNDDKMTIIDWGASQVAGPAPNSSIVHLCWS